MDRRREGQIILPPRSPTPKVEVLEHIFSFATWEESPRIYDRRHRHQWRPQRAQYISRHAMVANVIRVCRRCPTSPLDTPNCHRLTQASAPVARFSRWPLVWIDDLRPNVVRRRRGALG
jgi:hypothetical protein